MKLYLIRYFDTRNNDAFESIVIKARNEASAGRIFAAHFPECNLQSIEQV